MKGAREEPLGFDHAEPGKSLLELGCCLVGIGDRRESAQRANPRRQQVSGARDDRSGLSASWPGDDDEVALGYQRCPLVPIELFDAFGQPRRKAAPSGVLSPHQARS